MNRYPILVLIFLSLLFQQCSHKTKKDSKSTQEELSYKLPKLLIITSGTEEGYGKLAQGIVIAIQTFTANGVLTSIKSRDILNRPEELEGYNFMLLSTALGYHDADRRYSLSYMSDFELDNIRNFVKIGGVLIAGDNVGRNQLDGNDRISLYGQLNPSNWALSDCFGLCLQELNMKNYRLNGFLDSNLNGQFKDTSATDLWILVGDSIHSSNLKQWAKWENGENQYPAIVQNEFGKGIGFLLPSSYYLHPANDGGYWSALQIESFYKLTIHAFNEKNKNKISINPWPNGYEQAFCISLNASGSLKEMKRLSDYFKQVNITPTYFVNGKIKDEAIDFLKKCELQSNGFARINYRNVLYPESKTDMYENEVFWDKQFKGFRFPYTRSGFWGLLALDELGYSYESSIGADNIEQYLGCVFPYHIPISNNNYYKTTSILELSPTYHDDYYFFKDILSDKDYTLDQQSQDAKLYSKYLHNYWEYAVKPYHGLMVFMGHPAYVGYSDTTLSALKNIIAHIKKDNSWITSLDEVADYWNQLNKMTFEVSRHKTRIAIKIISDEHTKVEQFCLNLQSKPKQIRLKTGSAELIEKDNLYHLVFDAFDGQVVEFSLEE